MNNLTALGIACVLSLSAHAWTPPPKDSKVSADLMALASDPTATLRSTATGTDVIIDTAASGDPEALASDLRALGARRVTVFGRMVSAIMPSRAIPNLNNLVSLQSARPAYRATMVGDVTSQGDAAMRSDIARSAFGINGAGVQIGTLSDSFDCLGGAGQRVASGDLPAGVIVVEEFDACGAFGIVDEGQAMMEIIHDVAPGSPLSFHSAFLGQANFAQGILDLADAGAKVINDDVLYFAEPMFQDGIIAQAVDQVKARGISYFSAAGNYGRQGYQAPFRPSGVFIDIGKGPSEAHDFDPGPGVDTCHKFTIPQGQQVFFVYQWDQPFFAVSGPPGSASDMDLITSTPDCDFNLNLSGSAEFNVGRDPVESLEHGDNVRNEFGMMFLRVSGPAPGLMKMVAIGGSFTFDEFDTKTGTSWGHAAARGGLGVGAAPWHGTPVFGVDPPVIEPFSSAGGVPILFDTAGNRLPAAQVRQQPDITAPDAVNTVSFGIFPGTSAAAPHAAGVAALMKDLVPTLTPDRTYAALKSTAIDMDDPATGGFDRGFDFGTGFGLIQADAAINAVAPEPEPIPPVIPPVTTPPRPPTTPPIAPIPPPEPTGPGEPPPVVPRPPVAPVTPRAEVLCRGLRATIVGTEDRDIIIGTRGRDVIHGLGGNDVIRGGRGNDVICGGAGRDRISGGLGRDRLFGESGRDGLEGGPGRDRCRGGAGIDTALGCE